MSLVNIKWEYLHNLVKKEKPGIICIQKTKLVSVNSQKCYALWGSNNINWVHRSVDVDGGGILTMWHNQIFNCIKTVEGKGFIIIIREYKTGESDRVVKVGVIILVVTVRKWHSEKKLYV